MEKHATLFRVDTKAVPLHFQSLLEISREECWLQRSQNTTAWRVFSLCAMGQGVELAVVVWQRNITWCSVLAWPENGIFHGDYSTLWAPPPRHFHSQSLSPSSGFPDSRQTAHSTAGIPTVLVTKAALSKFSEMGNSTTPQKNRQTISQLLQAPKVVWPSKKSTEAEQALLWHQVQGSLGYLAHL